MDKTNIPGLSNNVHWNKNHDSIHNKNISVLVQVDIQTSIKLKLLSEIVLYNTQSVLILKVKHVLNRGFALIIKRII